jgi:hypothetical protein
MIVQNCHRELWEDLEGLSTGGDVWGSLVVFEVEVVRTCDLRDGCDMSN